MGICFWTRVNILGSRWRYLYGKTIRAVWAQDLVKCFSFKALWRVFWSQLSWEFVIIFWFFFPRKVLKLQLHHQKVKFVIICFWLVLIPLFVNDKSVQPLFSRCLVWLHISDCKLFMRNTIRFLSRHCFGYKVPLVLTFALSWSENCWNENFWKGLKVEIFLNIQMIYLLFIK